MYCIISAFRRALVHMLLDNQELMLLYLGGLNEGESLETASKKACLDMEADKGSVNAMEELINSEEAFCKRLLADKGVENAVWQHQLASKYIRWLDVIKRCKAKER